MAEARIVVVVDVDTSPQSVPSLSQIMQGKIDRGQTNMPNNFTIFRIPQNISQSRKYLFEPSVVSIGPFHRGKQSLKAMEEHKWRLLGAFLSRGSASLDHCITEMNLLEEDTRKCYNETFEDLDRNAFVEMMLLDGCFLLELCLQLNEEDMNFRDVGWNCVFQWSDLLLLENQIPFFIVEKLYELIGCNQDDRVNFFKSIAFNLLPRSYILPDRPAETPDTRTADPPAETPDTRIADPPAETPDTRIADPPAETPDTRIADPPAEIQDPPAETPHPPAQIPYIRAKTKKDLANLRDPPAEIHHLVHLCYHYVVPDQVIPVVSSNKPCNLTRMLKRLLQWFRSRVLRGRSPQSSSGSSSEPLPNSTGNLSSMVIPSATELKQKGLKFTPNSNSIHMLDISFEYGALKIPRLKIFNDTKPIFTNLMAFEQSKYIRKDNPFGRFLSFLDKLINTPNDVTILQECGIIENCLGSEEELANFINQVTEGNNIEEEHYLAGLYTHVNRYIESSWHMHRSKFIHDYLSSPWAIISLIAAFILLVLTLVQSFFAVLTYFRPPKP